MRVHKSSVKSGDHVSSVRDRILGEVSGCRDEALIFAASSIVNELKAPQYNGELVTRTVRTDLGVYTLRGNTVRGTNGQQPVVVVFAELATVEPGPARSMEKRIHSRFQLTRKEECVARLLAAEKSNDEIAAELSISRHTARHHTESVMCKLGVRSRKDIVSALRDD